MPTKENIYKLKIDEEFRRFIPPLNAKERKTLEENLIQDGCRDALCVWNKIIIDGHNRYEICTQHQIPFAIKHVSLKSREEAIAWICANQLGRRNINEETRRYLIGKRYEMEKMVGATNVSGIYQYARKEVGSQFATQPKFDGNTHKTKQRLGNEYNIDPATVIRYGAYAQAMDELSKEMPELHEKIMSGQLKLSQDKVTRISRLSPAEMRSVSTELIQNPYAQIDFADSSVMPKNTPHKVQLEMMKIGAVKDMPKYDPDAEILSLALTVPSWVSSINRVRKSAKFTEISYSASKKLAAELSELKSVVETMISVLEERN